MAKYIVHGGMVGTYTFRSLSQAKQNLRKQLKSKHIMGLTVWITQHNKNGGGIRFQYFTRTGDRTYKLVLSKKQKFISAKRRK